MAGMITFIPTKCNGWVRVPVDVSATFWKSDASTHVMFRKSEEIPSSGLKRHKRWQTAKYDRYPTLINVLEYDKEDWKS